MNLNKSKKTFAGLVKVFIVFSASLLYSQDLVVEQTTIESEESFTAQSITVGPDVTIDSTGKVTTHSNSLAVKGPFNIVSGGQFTVISSSVPVSISEKEQFVTPQDFKVGQNYPNPFNPITYIRYDLPRSMNVEINIYNVSGQKVKELLSAEQAPGSYNVFWDGTDSRGTIVSSGIYYYRIQAGRNIISRKMTFIK